MSSHLMSSYLAHQFAELAFLAVLIAGAGPAIAQQQPQSPQPCAPTDTKSLDTRYLPPIPQKFGGVINPNAAQSTPCWPARIVPPKGAPNILLIMTDDVGFGTPSTFGGTIPTPALDRRLPRVERGDTNLAWSLPGWKVRGSFHYGVIDC